MSLSENLKAARASKKLTQRQLAELSGVHLQYIKQLEGGKIPRIALFDIAKALGVKIDKLIGKNSLIK